MNINEGVKINLKGIKPYYYTGELVECDIDLNPSLFSKPYTIMDSDISLTKFERVKVISESTVVATGGNVDFHNIYDYETDETVVSRDIYGTNLAGHLVLSKKMRFRIPSYSVNSSISGLYDYGFYNDVKYAIVIKARLLIDGRAAEKLIEKRVYFTVYKSVDISPDLFLPKMDFFGRCPSNLFKKMKKVTIMTRTNSSKFLPGEVINCNVAIINKTGSPILKLMIIYHQLETLVRGASYRSDIVASRYGFSLKKIIKSKNSTDQEDQVTLKNCLNAREGNNITFKLPNNLPARVRELGRVKCSKIEFKIFFSNKESSGTNTVFTIFDSQI